MSDKQPRDFDFPPPLNNALAEWLLSSVPGLETHTLYEICRYMHNQFTQFNEKSKLQVVTDKLIVKKYLHSQYGQAIRRPFKEPAPGLRARFARFWTKIMPASYWVALRERFPKLARRDDGWRYGSVADPDAEFTRTVELKRVGFHQTVDPILMHRGQYDPERPFFDGGFEFMAGYEALTDTLYLHEQFWLKMGGDFAMPPSFWQLRKPTR